MLHILNTRMILVQAAILGALTTFLFFPGLMSFDSIYQYRQVIGDMPVQNYHPPIMVYAWQLGHGVLGPGSLLVFHQFMYWTAIALIGISIHPAWLIRFFVVLILGLLPPLWIHSATLWNDAAVMSSFLLAVACSLLLGKTGSRWVLLIGVVALFYGLSAKSTGLIAAIPLFFLLSDAWFRANTTKPKSTRRRWLSVSVMASGLMVSAVVFSLLLGSMGVVKSTKWPTIALWDLAAVSLAEHKVLIPRAELNYKDELETETLARIHEVFSPAVNGPLVDVVNLFPAEETQKELFHAWLALPQQYPASYLNHRVQVFGRLMGVSPFPVHLAFEHRIIQNDFGLRLLNKDSKSFNFAIKWVARSVDTLFYKSWFYLALLLAVLIYAVVGLVRANTFNDRFLVYLGLSGLFYVLPLLIVAPAADFRYTLWMVASSAVMTAFRVGALIKPQN
jgi:hypothetical protein